MCNAITFWSQVWVKHKRIFKKYQNEEKVNNYSYLTPCIQISQQSL